MHLGCFKSPWPLARNHIQEILRFLKPLCNPFGPRANQHDGDWGWWWFLMEYFTKLIGKRGVTWHRSTEIKIHNLLELGLFFFNRTSCSKFKYNILFWYRYLDYVVCLWTGITRQLDVFLTHINPLNKSIQFTIEIEANHAFPCRFHWS